jgi:shikimate dehydrogenase
VVEPVSSPSLQPILALLGYPVGGNPSQYVTEKAFEEMDFDWRYLTLEVVPADLEDAIRGIRALGFAGGNLADPHKESVIGLLDRVTESARRIGRVNVLLRDGEGLFGDNTEGRAIVELIAKRSPRGLEKTKIVLLGAGKIATAIAVELATLDINHLTVVNRTESRAVELVEQIQSFSEIDISVDRWDGDYRLPEGTDILIQATTVEEDHYEKALALDPESLNELQFVADLTIDPPHTWLLRESESRSIPTIDGVDLLCAQTMLNVKLWTDEQPDVSLLRDAVEEFLGL